METKEISFSQDIRNAVECIQRGGIILYPTDTIWGIGCDARNEEAVAKIFSLKRRADSKSMLALVGSDVQLERYVEEIPEIAWQLMEVADNPLTLIYDHPKGLAQNLYAPDGSLGIRVTSERFSKELCLRLGVPVVSTSANISGCPAPVNFNEISDEIINGVDYIVNYGRDNKRDATPSNIIKISDGGVIKVIR